MMAINLKLNAHWQVTTDGIKHWHAIKNLQVQNMHETRKSPPVTVTSAHCGTRGSTNLKPDSEEDSDGAGIPPASVARADPKAA
jgi:hypothetical protein